MRNIFYSSELQVEFDRNGYIILDLFSRAEAGAFLKLYDELEGAKGTANTNKNSYELSFFESDVTSKKRKFEAVYGFMRPLLDKYLDHYKPILINLFNKHHNTGEVPIHQNWTFVDESLFTSVSVWCPLLDVKRQNGTLEVVPGTQKVISGYRGPTIPWVFDDLNDIMKERYMVPLELRFGQVAVIDDSVIHFSGDNHDETERKAVQLIMKPEEAPTIHCFKKEGEADVVRIVDVDDDFFFDFNMWEIPKGGLNMRTIHYPIVKLTEPQLIERTRFNLLAT